MTLDEFLRWDNGTDTHFELIGGFPVAMAPPAAAHRILAVRLVSRIDTALTARRPCNAQVEAGVIRMDLADTYFEADIAATCERHELAQQALREPFLIVEILSPGTERHDCRFIGRSTRYRKSCLSTPTAYTPNCTGAPGWSGLPKSCAASMPHSP
jgi:Uma2 family endonuclease